MVDGGWPAVEAELRERGEWEEYETPGTKFVVYPANPDRSYTEYEAAVNIHLLESMRQTQDPPCYSKSIVKMIRPAGETSRTLINKAIARAYGVARR
jgi:hypothetical protein